MESSTDVIGMFKRVFFDKKGLQVHSKKLKISISTFTI